MHRASLIPLALLASSTFLGAAVGAEAQPPSLTVAATRMALPLSQQRALEAQTSSIGNLLKGGDVSVYWSGNISRHMRTAVIPRRAATRMLKYAIQPAIGKVTAVSDLGKLSLDEFLNDPRSGARGFVVIHKGKIVFEQYPGMRPEDSMFWASNAKPMTSLLVDLLINDGKIDQNKTMGEYLPDFRGTAWENIKVIDVLDMTPGLDTEENDETRSDPVSLAIRTFVAELGQVHPLLGKQESVRDVLKSAKTVRAPGTQFEYGSPVTEAVVLLTEEVTQKRWADLFDERVWSKMNVEGDLQIHLSPDGVALAHGVVSSRLRDMARFAMLYTPSWNKVSTEQVVTPSMIERIRKGVRPGDFFMKGFDGPVFTERLNAPIAGNSRQWDAVFDDGDFFKSGYLGQGIYVSPDRDLVIAFFSTNRNAGLIQRYLRPIAQTFRIK